MTDSSEKYPDCFRLFREYVKIPPTTIAAATPLPPITIAPVTVVPPPLPPIATLLTASTTLLAMYLAITVFPLQ
jgi:hypothetical protein